MKALISLENVSVNFPTLVAPPIERRGGARGMLRRLAYRPRALGTLNTALKSLWLTVNEGERLAIIGPNGSGKSTLLRVMAGSIPHSTGRITHFGEVAAILSAQTGFLPQATGYENIFLRGLVLGLSREKIAARLHEIENFAQLGDWLYQPVATYSNGMALRLAFAVSTSMSPDILIMDEWIGAGDARFLDSAQERLRNMVAGSRILILASHNEKVIRNFCTRAIVLFKGAIVFRGSVSNALSFYEELNELIHASKSPISA
jgi:ABC-type polysaccharide/polyol phosphate transport system ATPase subunit